MSRTLDPARPVTTATSRRSRRGLLIGLAALFAALLTVSVLSVAVGAQSVPLATVADALRDLHSDDTAHQIVAGRLPRLAAGLLVGVALGLAGAIMQGVTRNPLADPGLLGVNAGASLAVVVAINVFGITTAAGYIWFGFAGATLVAVLVYGVASFGRDGATPVKLLLAGAAIGAALISITTAVLLTDATTFNQYRFWTVGSLAGRRWDLIAQVAPFVLAGAVAALLTGRLLNTLSLGEEVARGLGQRVHLARVTAAAAAVVLCGAATAIAGPIWFVGLLVPHIARQFTGPDHRWILPYSMLLAPVLLLASDVLGRVMAPPGEVQAGIVLSFIGAPFLIALMRRRRAAAA
ncbi:FecCD family ABC transporter permease [Phytomonospora endophytica]|uniref:Iron complex transport system permease protein n=1 Tax=Phytomonospora endophytica TaxID=714109 RepID=A0A841FLB9_9ACTN|nr:iron chelate uptake ABC transporter family permease subunit [Phytomonospora endophytica]MBB6036735.1 iron complex transport system permease protein [Phytomonospora endophytica]GIG68231.1 iron ABC transporter permease [Phytomonospora endophytica]